MKTVKVETEKLSDGSEVFNVVMLLSDGKRVKFDCISRSMADALAYNLSETSCSRVLP